MEWEHKCSLEWLMARQDYLTASEIRSLIPLTKTGRARTVTDMDYLKVWSGKIVNLTEEDCWSTGAAARGHLLEPYAVDALNTVLMKYDPSTAEHYHHWDDTLVTMPERSIAFSPDAMNIPNDGETWFDANGVSITAIAEVKCYGQERHLATAYTEKNMLEERWQIATAMALCDTIEHAHLALFNPSLSTRRLFVIEYERKDLEKEIQEILEVEEKWEDFIYHGKISLMLPEDDRFWASEIVPNETTIIEDLKEKKNLNPV